MKDRVQRSVADEPVRVAPTQEEGQGSTWSPQQLLWARGGSAAPVFALQRMVGNRAVANLVAGQALGPVVAPRPIVRRSDSKSLPDAGRASLVQRSNGDTFDDVFPTSSWEHVIIGLLRDDKDFRDLWEEYSGLSSEAANQQCEVAASRIGGRLTSAGFPVEYFSVCWWESGAHDARDITNHYAVIVHGTIVIDATAQQFRNGKARIVDFGSWFEELRQMKKKPAKYVRGSWSECQALGRMATIGKVFWEAPGSALNQYNKDAMEKSWNLAYGKKGRAKH